MPDSTRPNHLDYITDLIGSAIRQTRPQRLKGRVVQAVGTIIKAAVPGTKVGEICILRNPWDGWELEAEVFGITGPHALLTPLGDVGGISLSTEVIPTGRRLVVPVGPGLLGRVLNGLGHPLDEASRGPIAAEAFYPAEAPPPLAMTRKIICKPIAMGVRALDGLLTCGEGQRMGVFAAAGGGKSTLLAAIVRNTEADVIVMALIGERGREVREFIENDLGPEGLSRAVVVVSTSDRPAMERLKAGYVATAIAEYYRDQGQRVLLLMDSVTRFARALREIGLAAGEPPARRGFPPSVFATLPRLMERAGQSDRGSITALYTVLVEGDDMTEPVADEVRSILDGHIILSRKLAAANHYPAIDILASISRVMGAITDREHRAAAARFRELLSSYQEVETLIRLGEYQPGGDAVADEAVAKIERLREYLRQGMYERSSFDEARHRLAELTGRGVA